MVAVVAVPVAHSRRCPAARAGCQEYAALYLSIPFSMPAGWSPGFCRVNAWAGSCRGVITTDETGRSGSCGALTAFPSSLGRTSFPLDIPFVKRLIKSFDNFLLVCLFPICSRIFFFKYLNMDLSLHMSFDSSWYLTNKIKCVQLSLVVCAFCILVKKS